VPPFSSDIVTAVLRHMNNDHTSDSLLISRAFGSPSAESATMTDLDENGGTFTYSIGAEQHTVTVPWSAPISERPQIRREVVVMYERACAVLGVEPRAHE
jgi:hypothetical protein